MPGLYGVGNANVTTSVTNTTGLYIGSGQASILNNAEQLLSLLSNNGTVFFQLDPTTANTQVEAFSTGNISGNNITVSGNITTTGGYFIGNGSLLTGIVANYEIGRAHV